MNDICTDDMTLDAIEKSVILKRYKRFSNNGTATANSLGITPKTLKAKLDRYAADKTREVQRAEEEAAERRANLDRARGIVLAHHPKAV